MRLTCFYLHMYNKDYWHFSGKCETFMKADSFKSLQQALFDHERLESSWIELKF